MKQVFDFVQGKLSYDEFEAEFTLHPEIWTWVQQLIPQDITDAAQYITTCRDSKPISLMFIPPSWHLGTAAYMVGMLLTTSFVHWFSTITRK